MTFCHSSALRSGHSTASTSPNLPPNNFPTPWATSTPLATGGQAGRNGTHGWVCTAPPQMPQQAGSCGVSQNGHLVQSTKPASRSSERQPLTPQQVSVLQLLRDAFAFDGYMENVRDPVVICHDYDCSETTEMVRQVEEKTSDNGRKLNEMWCTLDTRSSSLISPFY